MNTDPQPRAEPSEQPRQGIPLDLTPLNVIRTETILSRLPVHNLSKKGSIRIRILKRRPDGEIELSWSVSPSRDYGEPRQLAYKLDTMVINRRYDEHGRPLPKLIKLGSLVSIAEELGFSATRNTNKVKKALLENAGALITAKLNYRAVNGAERQLEAIFTRYSVVFTGQKLPGGRRADAVYILLNDPYWEVLNNAPVRPLDYDYLRKLPPAAHRFYEIVSFRVFAALNNRQAEARLSYSEYCMLSAQQRYFELWKVKRQMTPIHRKHLAYGYLKSVRYQQTTDAEGQPDWDIFYTPGPRARAEYEAFTSKSLTGESGGELSYAKPEEAGDGGRQLPESRPAQVASPNLHEAGVAESRTSEGPAGSPGRRETDLALLAELTRRGIAPRQAQKLLANLAADQQLQDQLEWGDYLVSQNPTGFRNPPGFYVSLIRDNIVPPETFQSTRRREQFRQREAARQQWLFQAQQLRIEYEQYCAEQKERYIREHLSQEYYQKLLEARKRRFRRQYPLLPDQTLAEMAHGAIRGEIQSQVVLLSFEEWKRQVSAHSPDGPA